MSFGSVLQRIRRAKGMSQRETARAIDMDYTYFSRLENDRFESKPTRETVQKVAKALGCEPDETSELLAAAGRIDEEMERLARNAGERPELKRLYRAVSGLTPEQIEQIEKYVDKKLIGKNKDKG